MQAYESPRHVRHGLWVALELLALVLLATSLSWSLFKAISRANLRANEQLHAQAHDFDRP